MYIIRDCELLDFAIYLFLFAAHMSYIFYVQYISLHILYMTIYIYMQGSARITPTNCCNMYEGNSINQKYNTKQCETNEVKQINN